MSETLMVCTKCGCSSKTCWAKYCGDCSNKDNEHDWKQVTGQEAAEWHSKQGAKAKAIYDELHNIEIRPVPFNIAKVEAWESKETLGAADARGVYLAKIKKTGSEMYGEWDGSEFRDANNSPVALSELCEFRLCQMNRGDERSQVIRRCLQDATPASNTGAHQLAVDVLKILGER